MDIQSSKHERLSSFNSSRVWLNIIEGHGFSSSLNESHVIVVVGDHRICGKKAEHCSCSPQWGEVFLLHLHENQDSVRIEVRGTEPGHLLSDPLFSATLHLDAIIEKGQIYKWVSDELAGSRVLVHAKLTSETYPLPSGLAHGNNRLSSLRIELSTHVLSPDKAVKGCVVFSANRTREFKSAYLQLIHHTVQGSVLTARGYLLFDIKLPLPMPEDLTKDEGICFAPGVYFWPFEMIVPHKIFHSGSHSNSSTKFIIRVVLQLHHSEIRGKWRQLLLPVNAPSFDEVREFPTKSYLIQDEPVRLESDTPILCWLSSGPLRPDMPKSIIHHVDRDILPSSNISSKVYKALYGREIDNKKIHDNEPSNDDAISAPSIE